MTSLLNLLERVPLAQNTMEHRRIYSVTELNAEIKALLEKSYPFIWISAEISNLRIPTSGHNYFSLKDARSQISAVMFRGQIRNLQFKLADGLAVTGFGRLSLYEPRGTYQIIFEYLEPKGVGALQMAFEQLKEKLALEGLFDEKHKKQLPFLPALLGIITSPSGSVIHDIINITERRYPNLDIRIMPVKVQGDDAADEIGAAIDMLNRHKLADVAILARGGGSLEDLQAFNTERVARAIFASQIPIISAVGHETDYTIADFVADLRAPTPSAAAELAVPVKYDLLKNIKEFEYLLYYNINHYIQQRRLIVAQTQKRLVDPRRRTEDARLKLDDYANRLFRAVSGRLNQIRERLQWRRTHLHAHNPIRQIQRFRDGLQQDKFALARELHATINRDRSSLREITSKLNAFNPASILSRGYSITRTLPDRKVVRTAESVKIEQDLEIILAEGKIESRVMRIRKNGEKNI